MITNYIDEASEGPILHSKQIQEKKMKECR